MPCNPSRRKRGSGWTCLQARSGGPRFPPFVRRTTLPTSGRVMHLRQDLSA
ncbi:Hypothetical protein AA314_01124 [Archangium gephyra]|uniref:Uncharacterized protein n=1 Tax=Archangium gephyra TaxID=48 RepID=A0AAC8Q206_9BACT|nr:Hypothetical protein AA314_01124 [Archangium gephyra]